MSMGVVQMFGDDHVSGRGESESSHQPINDNVNCEVVKLVVNTNIASGIPARSIYQQLESLLVAQGVDLHDIKIRSDYKIVSYLIRGMMDRVDGVRSDRCLLLDTLRHAFAYEEPLPSDTDEIFGDLLGRLN